MLNSDVKSAVNLHLNPTDTANKNHLCRFSEDSEIFIIPFVTFFYFVLTRILNFRVSMGTICVCV